MKSSKRALRRHHRQRMIQRALRSLVLSSWDDEETRLQTAIRWHNNLKKCSCWMCGNPRRYEGRIPTQEQRQLQAALDDMKLTD
jgi:hypothetical protein